MTARRRGARDRGGAEDQRNRAHCRRRPPDGEHPYPGRHPAPEPAGPGPFLHSDISRRTDTSRQTLAISRRPKPPTRRDLATRDFAPGTILVEPRFARKAQDPLAEDVLHDARRAALDRVGLHANERLLRIREIHRSARAFHRVTRGIQQRVGSHEVHHEAHDPLVEAGHRELANGPLWSGRPLDPRL